MKKSSHILSANIQADLNESNAALLFVLDLLTPLNRDRTGKEQVMFDNILNAAKKLPVNNIFDLAKYN